MEKMYQQIKEIEKRLCRLESKDRQQARDKTTKSHKNPFITPLIEIALEIE